MKATTLLFASLNRRIRLANSVNDMSASKRLKLSSMAPLKSSKESTGTAIVRFYDPDIQAKDALGRTQEQILAWNNSQLERSHNYIQMLFPLPEGSPFNWSAPVIDLETMKAFRARSELRSQLRRSFERMLNFYGFTAPAAYRPETGEENNTPRQEQAPAAAPPTSTGSTTEPVREDKQSAHHATGSEDIEEPANTNDSSPTSEGDDSSLPTQVSQVVYRVVRGSNWREASQNWCVRMDHNHLRITRIIRCLRVLGLEEECSAYFSALKRVYEDPSIGIGSRSMEFWTRAYERPLHIPPDDNEWECDWLKAWEKEQQSQT